MWYTSSSVLLEMSAHPSHVPILPNAECTPCETECKFICPLPKIPHLQKPHSVFIAISLVSSYFSVKYKTFLRRTQL